MKYSFAIAFFFTVSTCLAQRPIDVLHYNFSVELNDVNDSIRARAEIRFLNNQDNTALGLDLAELNKDGKGMIVDEIKLNGSNVSGFQHKDGRLIIPAGSTLKKGDTSEVVVAYRGIPADALIISKNKYGHRTFFADNWPNRGHNWLPCVDEPGDKAAVDFLVTAPVHYQVVSNGILLEETNLSGNRKLSHWREVVPVGTKVMVIGVAEFAVELSGTIADHIPVYSWVYPEDRVKGFYDYALANEILPFYIKYAGPYGYRKLANVQSKTIFGGLENANTIFYAENSITGTRSNETLLAHEIAHQWFGNMATERTFAHLWLSEGFATYMTILYMENKYGADTARAMLLEDRKQVIAFAKESQLTVVDETKDYMQLLNVNSYQKGGWILHMLRRQLGDTAFARSIRSYYASYAGKNADSRDLQQVFEKVSGKSLKIFFDQWLYTPGIPVLNIEWNYDATGKKLLLTVKQTQHNLFQFPLELALLSGTRKTVQKLTISKQSETFTINTKDKVDDIVIDPNVSLLLDVKTRKK